MSTKAYHLVKLIEKQSVTLLNKNDEIVDCKLALDSCLRRNENTGAILDIPELLICNLKSDYCFD
ncbi:hypothetical protein [Winogradskyella sp.]|uniref:hypothetical protein n=1 Tax=Winogradskyella sp. TaxID=1883156 RepID=UPI003F6BA402